MPAALNSPELVSRRDHRDIRSAVELGATIDPQLTAGKLVLERPGELPERLVEPSRKRVQVASDAVDDRRLIDLINHQLTSPVPPPVTSGR